MRRHRNSTAILLSVSALFTAACGVTQPTRSPPSVAASQSTAPPSVATTRDITDAAIEIATGDSRLRGFLQDHPFSVEAVRPVSGNELDVFVRFDDPVPTSEWPGDVCAIEQASDPMTGIHWRVDLDTATVVAVSPRWEDVSCIV